MIIAVFMKYKDKIVTNDLYDTSSQAGYCVTTDLWFVTIPFPRHSLLQRKNYIYIVCWLLYYFSLPPGPLIGRIHLISYWLLGTIWRWKNSLRGLLRWRRINSEREENCSRWCKCGASPTLPTPSSILASSIGTYNCSSSSSSSPSTLASHPAFSSSLIHFHDNTAVHSGLFKRTSIFVSSLIKLSFYLKQHQLGHFQLYAQCHLLDRFFFLPKNK